MNKNKIKNNLYDVVIVGAGPAGLSASLYAFRYKLKTLVIGKEIGGNLLLTSEIENFPGQRKIKGVELANIFKDSIKDKILVLKEKVTEISKDNNKFKVKTKAKEFKSKEIILALGAKRKKLEIPGEKEFEKRGVSYCAICDAPLFKGKKVVVVGGGNAAFKTAILLSLYAREVFLLARRGFIADPVLIDEVKKNRKIKIFENKQLKEIKGQQFVSEVILSKKISGKIRLKVEGVFVEVGIDPDVEILKKLTLKKDKKGFIKTNDKMETSIPGLYAIGDLSTGSGGLRQIITAASEGAIAATSIYQKLKEKN